MDPAIHRTMDVKFVDSSYPLKVNLMNTTGAITLQFFALCAKRCSAAPNLNKQFECDKCDESYVFESELKTHKIVHRTIKMWICARKGCDRDFKWKGDLVAHAKTHSSQVFVCTICNNFSTKVEKNLKQHERCHMKELKYKCHICSKGFFWTQQVKRHIEQDHT